MFELFFEFWGQECRQHAARHSFLSSGRRYFGCNSLLSPSICNRFRSLIVRFRLRILRIPFRTPCLSISFSVLSPRCSLSSFSLPSLSSSLLSFHSPGSRSLPSLSLSPSLSTLPALTPSLLSSSRPTLSLTLPHSPSPLSPTLTHPFTLHSLSRSIRPRTCGTGSAASISAPSWASRIPIRSASHSRQDSAGHRIRPDPRPLP